MKKELKKALKLIEESERLIGKAGIKADCCLEIIAPLIDLEITDDVGMVYQEGDGWCICMEDKENYNKAPINIPIKEEIKMLLNKIENETTNN